jgi:tetratricopeptide (TPR) repeat protein
MDKVFAKFIETSYPFPIAATFHRIRMIDEDDIINKHDSYGDLFESILKFLAIIILQDYKTRVSMPQHIDSFLKNMSHPALGHWNEIIRLISLENIENTIFAKKISELYYQKVNPELKKNADFLSKVLQTDNKIKIFKDIFDLLIIYRNKVWKGHGAKLLKDEYQERIVSIENVILGILKELKFLSEFELFYIDEIIVLPTKEFKHKARLCSGVQIEPKTFIQDSSFLPNHIYLRSISSKEEYIIDLYPLMLYHHCKDCKREQIFFFNDYRKNRLEFLSYSCGHFNYPEMLPDEFEKLFKISLSKMTDTGKSQVRKKIKTKHKRFKYAAALLLLIVAVYFFFKEFINNVNPNKIVKDLIVLDTFKESNKDEKTARLNSEILTYLITDNILQTSDKNIFSSDEFLLMYGHERIPELEISGELNVRNIGYSIKMKCKKIHGKTKRIFYDFADPATLINSPEGIIPSISKTIIKNFNGNSIQRSSTFTQSWDAFEMFFKGEKAWQKLDITNAEKYYKAALTYDKNFILARQRYAQVLVFNGYNMEAKTIINEIIPQTGQLSKLDSLKTQALEARLNGEFLKENDILKKIYNKYPTRKECAYEVAESYYDKCDVEKAIDYYNYALKLDPNFALAHNHIAYCFSHMGEHAKALNHFKIYLSLDSTANSFDSFGDGLMTAGKLDSAEWAKKQGIDIDPNLYYLWGSLGYINIRQGKFIEADRTFQQYINLANSRSAKAKGYFRKALIPFYKGQYEDALKLCKYARNLYDTVDIIARDHEMHWLSGYLHLLLDQPKEAVQEFEVMKELADNHDINATNYQADFYKFRLHLECALKAYRSDLTGMLECIEEFDSSIKNKVKDHTSNFDLAFFNTSFGELMLWDKINQRHLAEERFLKALEYNPNYAFAHYNLWKLYDQEGNTDLASRHLNEFKKIWENADQEVKIKYQIE